MSIITLGDPQSGRIIGSVTGAAPPIQEVPGGVTEEVVYGSSVPIGIEGVIEYRGSFLNVRSWHDTIIVSEIDGLADADIRDAREVNPNAHGETAFASYYGGRTIALTGRIRAMTLNRLRDLQQGLRQTFTDLSTEYPLVFHSNNTAQSSMIYCKKSAPIAMREAQTNFEFTRDFLVTLRASNPRIMSLYTEFFQHTWTSAQGQGSEYQIGTVMNNGNFPAQPQIQISGPVTNPKITFIDAALNKVTGIMLFNGTILAGETWYVDIAKRTIQDFGGSTKFNALAISSDWPELIPGATLLQLNGTGMTTQTSWSFIWRHTWM